MPAGRSNGDYYCTANPSTQIRMKIKSSPGESSEVYFYPRPLFYFKRKPNIIKKFNSS
jgi:hypothetical protein